MLHANPRRVFFGVTVPRGVIPDISVVTGQYTYLLSEVVFGVAALGLLYWANAMRRAARTIIILYPIAYVWDWYTLTIGVFEIHLRTGVDFLGIPIEEHLFILVVSSFVIGIHEAVAKWDRSR